MQTQSEELQAKIKLAMENLAAGYSCSEALMLAYGKEFGLAKETAVKLASGFGGGMGLMGETCGAVTAAYMVLGLKFGTADVQQSYSRDLTYDSVARFADYFRQEHGTTICRELTQGADMATPEGRGAIRDMGKTPQIVADAIRIIERIDKENS